MPAAAGAVLVAIAALDVFFTILFPASGRGPLRKPVSRMVWKLLRAVATHRSGQRRRDFLAYAGPIQIVATLAAWFLILLVGWAMIYKPALGTGITAVSGPTDTGWATALYYSGFTLTTLGVGDVAAKSGLYRILTILQAAMGFSYFGMTITYFLSVYSSLLDRNAFAEELYQKSSRRNDAAELIAKMAVDGDLHEAHKTLERSAAALRKIHQAHRFYPVMRYFQYRQPHHALPRILMTALDAVTLIRTALSEERYPYLIHSAGPDDLHEAAAFLLAELTKNEVGMEDGKGDQGAWVLRYQSAVETLSRAGLSVRSDLVQGARDYLTLRGGWDPALRRLAEIMLYDWDEIDGR